MIFADFWEDSTLALLIVEARRLSKPAFPASDTLGVGVSDFLGRPRLRLRGGCIAPASCCTGSLVETLVEALSGDTAVWWTDAAAAGSVRWLLATTISSPMSSSSC